MITGKKDIELFGLLSLRKRLELEIKWPGFATRLTLQACRNRGFDGRTRKKALMWINEILRPFDERNSKSYLSETTFIGINSADIKEHSQNSNMLEVTVDFVSEIISCVKDKDKKVLSGDPQRIKKVHDTWKFTKDKNSSNPNWLLVDTQI